MQYFRQIFCEGKILLKLCLPILVSSLTVIGVGLTDTAFIGRTGTANLAGVAAAAAIYSVLQQALAASTSGYQILAARYFGADKREKINVALLSNAILSLPLALGGIALLWYAQPLVAKITSDPEVIQAAVDYLRFRSPSLFFSILAILMQGTLDAKKQTQWGMYANCIVFLANIPLDYLFIFGAGPFPAMGVAGAALASTLSVLCGVFFLTIVTIDTRLISISQLMWDRQETLHVLRLNFPEIINAVFDYVGNFIFVSIIGLLGTASLAGGRIAFQLLIVLFILAMSFSAGIRILMGHSLGGGDDEGLRKHMEHGRIVALLLVSFLGIFFILFPTIILHFFTNSQEVMHTATGAVMVIGFSAPLMVWTAVYSGGLRAYGQTAPLMYSNLISIWFVQIPIGWLLGVRMGYGLTGLYYGFAAYFLVRAMWSHLLFVRNRQTEFSSIPSFAPAK